MATKAKVKVKKSVISKEMYLLDEGYGMYSKCNPNSKTNGPSVGNKLLKVKILNQYKVEQVVKELKEVK